MNYEMSAQVPSEDVKTMSIQLTAARLAAILTAASLLCVAAIGSASAATITLVGTPVFDVDTDPATVATVSTATSQIISDINISVRITGGEFIDEFFSFPGHMEDWSLEIEHLGTTVLLRAAFGFPPHLDSPFVVTFDDEAATLIGTNGSGTFRPEGSLSDFDGLDFAGDWNLSILDLNNANEGDDLEAWSVTLTTVPEPSTLAIFGLGLAGLGWARRRRVA